MKSIGNGNGLGIYAAALLIGVAGAVMTMLFHPTGRDLLGQPSDVAAAGEMMSVVTHAVAIASGPLIFFGFLGLASAVGYQSPAVRFALTGWGLAVMAALCATVIDGFVAPRLTRRILQASADPAMETILRQILAANTMLNQAFSEVYAVAASASIFAWSLSVFRRSAAWTLIAAYGLLIGFAVPAALLFGYLGVELHGFRLIVLSQVFWIVSVAILMIIDKSYRDPNFEPSTVE
jgi:hypothetical protein